MRRGQVDLPAAAQLSRGTAVGGLAAEEVACRVIVLCSGCGIVEGVEHQVHVFFSLSLEVRTVEVFVVFVYCDLHAALSYIGGRP